MTRIKVLVAAITIAVFGAFSFAAAGTVGAIDPGNPLADVCQTDPNNSVCQSQDDSATELIYTLINVLLFVVGSLAVIMIIVGGILYAISNGDASRIAKAKNTIMYSIVGLIVAFLAFAIVNWVVKVL